MKENYFYHLKIQVSLVAKTPHFLSVLRGGKKAPNKQNTFHYTKYQFPQARMNNSFWNRFIVSGKISSFWIPRNVITASINRKNILNKKKQLCFQ